MTGIRQWATGAATLLLVPFSGEAAPITSGVTNAKLTFLEILYDQGISYSFAATGSANYDPTTYMFTAPITGGSVGGGDFVLEHDTSGFLFSGGGVTLGLEDFVIDSSVPSLTATYTAPVSGNPFSLADFGLTIEVSGMMFTISPGNDFDIPGVSPGDEAIFVGQPLVNGDFDPTVVPLPAPAFLLLGGLAALGAASRRRGA